MSDFVFFCVCIAYLFWLCGVIIICIYIDYTYCFTNQGLENMQRSCNNQDLNQETFSPPPYLHLVDFTHCFNHDFPNSDLPPSYENCALEPQPPPYSSIVIYSPSMNIV